MCNLYKVGLTLQERRSDGIIKTIIIIMN